jgi:hypothetical protein
LRAGLQNSTTVLSFARSSLRYKPHPFVGAGCFLGVVLHVARRYYQAVERALQAINYDPNFWLAQLSDKDEEFASRFCGLS